MAQDKHTQHLKWHIDAPSSTSIKTDVLNINTLLYFTTVSQTLSYGYIIALHNITLNPTTFLRKQAGCTKNYKENVPLNYKNVEK